MKRSEMIDKITKEYINKKLNYMNVEFNILYKNIDFLLSLFEEEGMLPPFNAHSHNSAGDLANYNDVRFYHWESEGDEVRPTGGLDE